MVKGRAKRPELRRAQVKVRNIDKSVEDLEKEQQLLKERRTRLKADMIEETHNA